MSHGDGRFNLADFRSFGTGVVIEPGVLIFHPENILLSDNVYVGHYSILKGYYRNRMIIGEGTWIGQQCFLHSAGGLVIGRFVGIGPGVKVITSSHDDRNTAIPVIDNPLTFGEVVIGDGADIGTGAVILPGVTIGEGAVIGAGAVVTTDVEPYTVVAGVPARQIRSRKHNSEHPPEGLFF
jgi:acetyltransferase-like isoleucine patch superfamily enzyme